MDILGISPETWFPIITLLIGAVLKGVFDALSDRRAAHRDREARKEQRNDAIRLRRMEVQREVLLELQDAVMNLARCSTRIHLEDLERLRKTNTWDRGLVSEELSDASLLAEVKVNQLRVRVAYDKVRELTVRLCSTHSKIVFASSLAVSNDSFNELNAIVKDLHERIGMILRSLDEDEDEIVGVEQRKS